MTAEPHRTHPLASRLTALSDLPKGLEVAVEPYLTMTTLRVPPGADSAAAAAAVKGVLGVTPPVVPNTWVGAGAADVVWLGPEEWVAVGDLVSVDGPLEQEVALREALVPFGGAAVDVSGQRVRLVLRGDLTRDVLAKGCALDLHPRVFPAGSCAQTTLGRAGVVLLARDEPSTYAVLVRPSFAGYLVDWLLDAVVEYRAAS